MISREGQCVICWIQIWKYKSQNLVSEWLQTFKKRRKLKLCNRPWDVLIWFYVIEFTSKNIRYSDAYKV